MRTITHYTLVKTEPRCFEATVEGMIAQGWQPFEQPFQTTVPSRRSLFHAPEIVWVQAMVRYAEKP